MAKQSNATLRKRLEEERARLQEDRARLREAGGFGQEVGEIADLDLNHPGDVGTEMFEREKEVALAENIDAMLAQVEEALARMDAGTYGICERCGRPISPARLEALPYALFCVDCQARVENQ